MAVMIGLIMIIVSLMLFMVNAGETTKFLKDSDLNELKSAKYVVVGAGLWGSTIAEQISTVLKEPVIIIDKRDHIGGNCWSEVDSGTGIEFHRYGSHIFHTSLDHVWSYINQFTEFTTYKHHVMTEYQGKTFQFPINLKTINDYYNINLKPGEVDSFVESETKKYKVFNASNLEAKAIQLIGQPLYEAFVKGYTEKQWQKHPSLLPPEIIQRLPIRKNYKSGYFEDTYEGLPKWGYYNLFYNMTKSPLIRIMLNTDWFDVRDIISEKAHVFYSGPIDAYFDYRFGRLEYRSLEFNCESREVQDFQGISVMNYADSSVPYTRIHEFKHLHPERLEVMRSNKTLICYEFPRSAGKNGEEYYPINTKKNQEIFRKYAMLLEGRDNLVIAGRLGSYRYLDMDKVLDIALRYSQIFLNKRTCQLPS